MKCNRFKIFLFAACAMFAFGCGDSGNSGNTKEQPGGTNEQPGGIVSVQNRTVSGVSQKGPFVTGASVTVQELEGLSLLQTGKSFKGNIKNDRGEFSIAGVSLISQYAMLVTNGFYFNEVTGENSSTQIEMKALTDLSDRENVNVNLLTHLEADRVAHLVTNEHLDFAKAKEQAHKELLGYFGFSGVLEQSEDMNIIGNDDSSAALLAISVIVRGDLSESKFTERMTNISVDIEDGTIDNAEIWNDMAKWASYANLEGIRRNVEKLGEEVPNFEKYVKQFQNEYYHLGDCSNEGEYKSSGDSCFYCGQNGWEPASLADSDIYCKGGGVCSKDGNLLSGYYVCNDNQFRVANPFEITIAHKGCTNYNIGESIKPEGYESYLVCGDNQAWSSDLTKNTGKMTDSRDETEYRTVVIGNQTWLRDNLRYNISGSKCVEGDNANCSKYGRIYSWDAAQNACPEGYHLPTSNDWLELLLFTSRNFPAYAESITKNMTECKTYNLPNTGDTAVCSENNHYYHDYYSNDDPALGPKSESNTYGGSYRCYDYRYSFGYDEWRNGEYEDYNYSAWVYGYGNEKVFALVHLLRSPSWICGCGSFWGDKDCTSWIYGSDTYGFDAVPTIFTNCSDICGGPGCTDDIKTGSTAFWVKSSVCRNNEKSCGKEFGFGCGEHIEHNVIDQNSGDIHEDRLFFEPEEKESEEYKSIRCVKN